MSAKRGPGIIAPERATTKDVVLREGQVVVVKGIPHVGDDGATVRLEALEFEALKKVGQEGCHGGAPRFPA